MKLTRSIPHLRSAKFTPFAIMALFLLSNFTGIFFSPVFAPSVNATTQSEEIIPQDIPTSGDPTWTGLSFAPVDVMVSTPVSSMR